MITVSPYAIPGIARTEEEKRLRDFRKANQILNNICNFLGVEPKEVISKKRKSELVYARQWYVWFTLQETKLTLRSIGELIGGRDHTTAIHLRDVVRGQLSIKTDNYYKEDFLILQDVAMQGVAKYKGRPTRRKAVRKVLQTSNQVEAPIVPIKRAKAIYTNTNFEQQLEERAKALAI